MRLNNTLYIKGKNILSKRNGAKTLLSALALLFAPILAPSCTDDLALSEGNGPLLDETQTLITYDLPGVFGFALETLNIDNTRSDNTSDGRPFADGSSSEYALSEKSGNEFYHYLLLFETNNSQSKPVIFPIEDYTTSMSPEKNVTLTVSKVFADGAFNETIVTPEGLNSKSVLVNLFKGRQAYVVLNFKLDSDNYICNHPLNGSNTVQRLASMTKEDFESLQLKNVRVQGKRTITTSGPDGQPSSQVSYPNFFTMSNSVYSTGTNVVVDGTTVDTNKIFDTEEEAVANPAIVSSVERLAAKVVVNFNAAKMKEIAYFGPSEADRLPIDEVTIESDGLPLIQTWVNRVNMDNDGIEYDNNGYEIKKEPVQARIKILGFGLSNLETSVKLLKNIRATYGNRSWQWNDPDNRRCYWAEDPHHDLVVVRSPGGVFTKIQGYPHQFRRALDSDSVSSYHSGQFGDYEYSKGSGSVKEEYKIGDDSYTSYAEVGNILDSEGHRISGVVLDYKSFEELQSTFSSSRLGYSINSGTKTSTFDPLYTMENTYTDEGMLLSSAWQWPWYRAPHGLTTNLMVLAQIEIKGNLAETSGDTPGEGPSTREGDEDEPYVARTLYLGQNNIFYLRKVNLLRSKLAILNNVMLSGGNAGIQILRGQWDSHQRADGGDNLLDKVAWNEGSKLWIAEVMTKKDSEGNDLYEDGKLVLDYEEKIGHDADNKEYTYNQVKLEKAWLAYVDNSTGANEDDQDLDLIPAEISGGDGQCLIAPNKKWMGAKYKYYLAPESAESTEANPKMDVDKAVEISYNHLVALIHKIIGPVDVYTNGYMYYNAPIPHHISGYNGKTGATDWAHFGSYSVVRNNWYNISVTEFSKLGTPVHVSSQPIVPVMDVKRSYINMGIELLNWHDIIQDNIPLIPGM